MGVTCATHVRAQDWWYTHHFAKPLFIHFRRVAVHEVGLLSRNSGVKLFISVATLPHKLSLRFYARSGWLEICHILKR